MRTHPQVNVLTLLGVAVLDVVFAWLHQGLRSTAMKEIDKAVCNEQAPPFHSPEKQVHDITQTQCRWSVTSSDATVNISVPGLFF